MSMTGASSTGQMHFQKPSSMPSRPKSRSKGTKWTSRLCYAAPRTAKWTSSVAPRKRCLHVRSVTVSCLKTTAPARIAERCLRKKTTKTNQPLPLEAVHPVPAVAAPQVLLVAVHPARAKVVLPDRRRAAHLARAKEAPPVQARADHPGQRRAVHLAPARAVLPGRRTAAHRAPARAVLPGRRKAAHLAQAKAVLPVRAKVAHPRAAPAVARRRAVQAEVLERAAPLAALQKALAVVLPVAEQRRNRC